MRASEGIFGPEKPSRTTLQIRFLSITISLTVRPPHHNQNVSSPSGRVWHVGLCSLFQYSPREDLLTGEIWRGLHHHTRLHTWENVRSMDHLSEFRHTRRRVHNHPYL